MCVELLKNLDGDESLREADILTEQQHIAEFDRLKALEKPEKDCKDINEVIKLRDANFYERQRIMKAGMHKKINGELKLAFRKLQKTVDPT